jgi:hypothetical protein
MTVKERRMYAIYVSSFIEPYFAVDWIALFLYSTGPVSRYGFPSIC